MKVYITFQSDYECGGNFTGKVFDSEEKAKNFIDLKNEELHKEWSEFADTEPSSNWEKFKTKEEYITHMIDQERYYYIFSEVK